MRVLATLLAPCVLGLVVGAASTQIPAGHLLVASRMPGASTTLLDVDPQTGVVVGVGRFPSAGLPPLAVTIDPVNRDVVLALDLGGSSRIVRLELSGLSVVQERLLADVPGTCTQIVLGMNADLYVSIDGAGGGLSLVPRNGGTAVQQLAAPYLTALAEFGFPSGTVLLAQSGVAGPPVVDPQIGFYDVPSGQWTFGPFVLTGFTPRGITGAVDIPTGVPRQVLSHPDGTFSLNTMGAMMNPVPIPTAPALPPGGAVALKAIGGSSFDPIVLGGAAHPFLETFTVFLGPTPAPLRRIAGPLPGDPVDFAVAPDDFATLMPFGTACGTMPPMRIGVAPGSGLPRLGNASFAIGLSDGTANTFAIVVLGLSDQRAGAVPLPAVLPSGCALNVSPEVVAFHTTDAMGRAQQPVPVPNQPGLVGFLFFAQWLQAPGLPFATSQPAVIVVGL